MFQLDALLARAFQKELIPENQVKQVCQKAKEILVQEANVRCIQAPVTLVGDVHGQFYDLLEIFRIGGLPPDTNYVFLGDYVDRGRHSVETIMLLTLLKIKYPDRVTLVRGNHECRSVTQTYGFLKECSHKYGNTLVWTYFTDLFDYFILSVLIDNVIMCVHGGLSPSIHTLDQIRIIDRFREIPHEGPMSDLVWSDPFSSDVPEDTDFAISPRGAGYIFGRNCTEQFLSRNGLAHLCRAHQLCMEGYQVLFDDMISTVWSAPNYCYKAGNLASILEISDTLHRKFNVFGPCPDQRISAPTKQHSRLDDLLDEDGVGKKRLELSRKGFGLSHSIDYEEELVQVDAIKNSEALKYFT